MSASEDGHSCGFEAWQVLAAIYLNGWTMLVDTEGFLVSQYFANIKGNSKGASWFGEMKRRSRIYYVSGRLPSRHRKALTKLGFDDDDESVAAIASATAPIVTDDSDFIQSKSTAYLSDEMGIELLPTCGALDTLQKQEQDEA